MSTTTFSRTNISVIGRWWLGVDRWTIAALVVLAAAGVVLAMAASPAVAEHLGKDIFYFAKRQLFFLAPAVVAIGQIVSLRAGLDWLGAMEGRLLDADPLGRNRERSTG